MTTSSSTSFPLLLVYHRRRPARETADQSGSDKDAERELVLADRLRPGDWHILALLADRRAAQGHHAEALGSVAEALRLAPQEPELYARQARILLDQARAQAVGSRPDIAPALRAAQQCLALDPDDADAHVTLGTAYRDADQGAEARREWEKAYALEPDNPTLAYNLGRLRSAQGDRAAGLQLLAAAAQAAQEKAAYDRLVVLAGHAPRDPRGHRALARWCQAHHHLSRAIFEWQEVLAALPQDAEAQAGTAKLLPQRG